MSENPPTPEEPKGLPGNEPTIRLPCPEHSGGDHPGDGRAAPEEFDIDQCGTGWPQHG